jgi:DNA-binding MarR family transcriptional regulator
MKSARGGATRARGSALRLDERSIGLEARVSPGDHQALRLWLRLLSSSTQIETEIRKRLRLHFGITLSRFDYLAQLHRHREGLRMNALSRYLMVTGGSITGLTDELEKEGLVAREASTEDRRSYLVRLTEAGRVVFERIASEHERWIVELFSDLQPAERETLYELLGSLRLGLAARQARAT